MKKIGFIDLFIDEWHANHYPAWFKETPLGGEFELGYAYEKENHGGWTLDVWCRDFQMIPAKSIEEVVEKSDCICVLAPANPEVHETLAEIPLKSGKPLYIDKPFAPSKAVAERIFATAEKYHTPLMSSSALRYGDELLSGKVQELKPQIISTTGGGRSFDEYGIHQLEMVVSMMGCDVRKVNLTGDTEKLVCTLEYSDGRLASLNYNKRFPFSLSASGAEGSVIFGTMTNTFQNLLADMLRFFKTGKSNIPAEQTVGIAGLLEESVSLLHKK